MTDRNEELITGGDARAPLETEETIEIRAEIRETRDRMGDTIEELGERLNPRHLRQQIKDDVRDATIGRVENMAHTAADKVKETRRSIADTVRENPIPAAMVGIGLGWLYLNGRKHDAPERYYEGGWQSQGRGYGGTSGYGYGGRAGGYAAGYGEGFGGPSGPEEEGRLEHLRDRASEMGHSVSESASELGQNVSEGASHLAERAQEVASDVAHRAQDVVHDLADTTRHQMHRVEDQFFANPLVIGAATLALGFAAGAALPRTRTEARIMGPARDQFVERVKETADDTKEKVKHVAERVVEEAQETAREAAEEEGLTA